MNIATIVVGIFDEDLREKLVWTRPLQRDWGHHVYIAGRAREGRHVAKLLPMTATNPTTLDFLSDSPYFNKHYDEPTQLKLEEWLKIPFKHLVSYDRKFFDRKKYKDSRGNLEDLYNYLTGLINFFKDFFVGNNIDIFVTGIEDFLFSVVSYYVARRLEIPIVTMVPARFPKHGTMFCKGNFSDLWCWNEDDEDVEWEEILSMYKDIAITKPNIFGVGKYWHPRFMFENLKRATEYTQSRNSMIRICKCERYIVPSIKWHVNGIVKATVRKISNRIFFQEPDNEDHYFFFPIHYENDAQITFREPFVNQFELVKAISRSLPQGTCLYVKPHPHFLGADVSSGDLRDISGLGNVKVINPTISPIFLIKNCIGVITINSTTGFEAMLYNKPVISFGHDFYCRDDLCYLIRDVNRIPETLLMVLKRKKPLADREYARRFIKSVYRNTVFTEGQLSYNNITDDDGSKIASALNKVLRLLGK